MRLVQIHLSSMDEVLAVERVRFWLNRIYFRKVSGLESVFQGIESIALPHYRS